MKQIISFIGTMFLFTANTFSQIEGEVVNEQNKPVQGVIITATDSIGKLVASVKSDIRGFYVIESLHAGKYKIEAKVPGFIPVVYKNVEVTTSPKGTDEGDDTYYAILIDITMARAKLPK